MNKTATVKHMANIGDIIASMISIKTYYEKTGRKVIFCQQLNVLASYYAGAIHPTKDEAGGQVMCNKAMFDMIKPLLLSQEYIEDVQVYSGQDINIDFDVIRKNIFVNMPNQAIQQWLFMAHPDLASDISKSWIHIKEVDISECGLIYPGIVTQILPIEDLKDKIVINFTERYRNNIVNYFFLKKHQNNLIFAGTEKEHTLFCAKWELAIPRLIVKDFLQLSYIIKNAKFLLSNQSFCWNVAESMKTPRILELCEYAPNCQSFIGEDSYGYFYQQQVQFYFDELINKK